MPTRFDSANTNGQKTTHEIVKSANVAAAIGDPQAKESAPELPGTYSKNPK